MEYNTTRTKIITKEYGRNIQELVESVITIEDRETRNQQARAIIKAMANLSSGSKKTADFWQKLWDEIFVISDFRLDIDSPFPIPEKKEMEAKPGLLPYPKNKIQFPPYGKNIENIIRKLSEEPDSPEKEQCIKDVAVYLKSMYLNYNRDSVNDEMIREHLRTLSDGKLKLPEDFVFPSTKTLLNRESGNNQACAQGNVRKKVQNVPGEKGNATPSKKKKKKKSNNS